MGSPIDAVPPSVNGWNAAFLESQHEQYLRDPSSVSSDVRAFFQGFELAQNGAGPAPASGGDRPGTVSDSMVQVAVGRLLAAYRGLGHHAASLDPFGEPRQRPAELDYHYHGLSDADLDRPVEAASLGLDGTVSLRDVINRLEKLYLGPIGIEFQHVQRVEEREWLRRTYEDCQGRIPLEKGDKVHILEQLFDAHSFEAFLGRRYPGEKRFSLEGAESLIPLLDHLIETLAHLDGREIVLGMAHRGRLNVLNQILGKTPHQIFTEFEDSWKGDLYNDDGGDVKYHRGYSGERVFRDGTSTHLAMASNPSHLEAVGAVVSGRCRSKQRLRHDSDRKLVVPVIIHGDAAVAGQGIVAEILNLSQLEGYATGGTIHVVVNNHIGFTTEPEDSRSTPYCTDVAKMIEAPVFHVNGEDPEAVVTAAHFAAEYRQKFNRDVFIDLWCYRRYGHNEQDEASFTQPIRAKEIKAKKPVLNVYAERLRDEGVVTDHDLEVMQKRVDEELDSAQQLAREKPTDPTIDPGSARWQKIGHDWNFEPGDTAISEETLREVCAALGSVPDGFNVNTKLKRLLSSRAALPDADPDEVVLNYADAELLAFGSLLLEGRAVRLSGQDSRRGTFSSRHSVLRDAKTGERFCALNSMRELGVVGTDEAPGTIGSDGKARQAKFCVYDSPLSEASVLGFDYGYSLADPSMLVCWEAQFGDFTNGAQVIIDQFIASAQVKWERWSGLTILLPHGFEGAGPEHSSARLERFLEQCGNENMQVVYPTTGAQIFHALRRQLHREFRKPLVVMAPKSMLRVPTSSVRELTEGHFQDLIDDPAFEHRAGDRSGVTRLIWCTGKIAHELMARRDETGLENTAIVRVEQLYPFNSELAGSIAAQYPNVTDWFWVQEEPRNMGAYSSMREMIPRVIKHSLTYIGREEASSPAPGSKKIDRSLQESVIARAIAPKPHTSGAGDASAKAVATMGR